MRKSGPRASVRTSPRELRPSQHDANPWMSWWWRVFVLAPVLFNAVWLAPELRSVAPSPNDSALHLLMVHAASDALRASANPLDFWIPQLELGFPQFLYYQNLPHLAIIAIHRLLLQTVELDTIFHVAQYVLLVAFPLTVAWSMRRMGFSAVATAVGAASSSLLSANLRFGFEYNSYIWRGLGLYTQLWGMHLSFVALAFLTATLNDGRGYVRTALTLALLALSHLVFAYMMAVTGVLVVVVGVTPRQIPTRLVRLGIVGAIACGIASYMLWPFLESSRLYLNSLPELGAASHRIGDAVASAMRGGLLDYDRLPVLTALAGIGVLTACVRRSPIHLLALSGFTMWLVLYLVRPSFGALGDLLPSHAGFISARFIGAVGLFAIPMIGLGGEAIWDVIGRAKQLSARSHSAMATMAVFLVLTPAVIERARTYRLSQRTMLETQAALASDTDLTTVMATLDGRAGRTFAGPRTGWANVMRLGPKLTVTDVVNAHRLLAIGSPLQGLALNSALLLRFRDGDVDLYDAFDVRTVVTPTTATVPAFFQPIVRTGRYAVWQVQTTGIAHYVEITDRRPAQNQGELYSGASDWFVGAAPGAHQVTRWDYAQSSSPAVPFTPIPRCPNGGRTLEEHVGSQRVSLMVECASAGALALKMSYHPNWRVQLDGADVPTYMVSPGFIGIDVPAGRHRLDATYSPTGSKIPLLVLGLLLLGMAVGWRHRLDQPAQWIATTTRRTG